MLNDFTGADKVYIACGYTDLRKGIDGLAQLVCQQFELDPFTNTLFLFCGRRRDRIKGLYWERDGFILLYKRLEQGVYQCWSRWASSIAPSAPAKADPSNFCAVTAMTQMTPESLYKEIPVTTVIAITNRRKGVNKCAAKTTGSMSV